MPASSPDNGSRLIDTETPGASARGFVFELRETDEGLKIFAQHHPDYGGVGIDWNSAELRRRALAGKRQLLARAVGLHKHPSPRIFDATGGLGRDAFTLAALGAHLRIAERQPLFLALLQDAHRRAQLDPRSADVATRIEILNGDARHHLSQLRCEVVYLDPMYPDHDRNARSKKEMQFLRELTDGDPDAPELLAMAIRQAPRVVVKRPLSASTLTGPPPSYDLKGTQSRFDIYIQQDESP